MSEFISLPLSSEFPEIPLTTIIYKVRKPYRFLFQSWIPPRSRIIRLRLPATDNQEIVLILNLQLVSLIFIHNASLDTREIQIRQKDILEYTRRGRRYCWAIYVLPSQRPGEYS